MKFGKLAKPVYCCCNIARVRNLINETQWEGGGKERGESEICEMERGGESQEIGKHANQGCN